MPTGIANIKNIGVCNLECHGGYFNTRLNNINSSNGNKNRSAAIVLYRLYFMKELRLIRIITTCGKIGSICPHDA